MTSLPPLASVQSANFFESMYQNSPDPWNFAGSAYERRRYATTIRSLLRPSYETAFEPGCSVGELTAELAMRCRRVIATDIAPTAIARARRRCSHLANVEIGCSDLLAAIPQIPLDLVVFSEIGYYFGEQVLGDLAASIAATLQSGGEFVAVHWLGDSREHVLHGNKVHDVLKEVLPIRWMKGERHCGFRIDTWVR